MVGGCNDDKIRFGVSAFRHTCRDEGTWPRAQIPRDLDVLYGGDARVDEIDLFLEDVDARDGVGAREQAG